MRALITGTSSGLGLALQHWFLEKGWQVDGTSPDGRGHDTAHRGAVMIIHKWDALNLNDTAALMERVRGKQFDVVINNAGINAITPFAQLSAGFLHDVMAVNCIAPVLLVQALLLNGMLCEGARICNVISDASWRPMRHSLAYNCSKAAFAMATKQMARELTKPNKLTIFGVNPGKMAGTEMSKYIDKQVCDVRGWSREQAMEYFRANTVTGQELRPQEVASFIFEMCERNMPISGAVMDLVG